MAEDWSEIVRALAEKRGVRYEAVGGLNPRGGPAALCPGGSNRLTGELAPEFWGASCDALEHEEGGLFRKTVVPRAILAKAHMPDVAEATPPFNVESLAGAEDQIESRLNRRKVEFESIDFNRRYIATVPKEHDPTALRETFSPGFLDWAAQIQADVDFGVSERQLYFLWRLRERTLEEYAEALDSAGGLFRRVRSEVEEHGVHTYASGPWHAGLEPFPAATVGSDPPDADKG
ncbi:MAG TPA: hypothetical protein VD766_01370 [Solirubrobacterales bacterium]|nr:hypothetical protein [Solirubrobacterales bacterium]